MPPAEKTAEFPVTLPPPPPWGGAQPLSDLVSAALQAPDEPPLEPPAAPPEGRAAAPPRTDTQGGAEPVALDVRAPSVERLEAEVELDIEIDIDADDDDDRDDDVDLSAIDLLDVPPRALELLRRHFRGEERRVAFALDRFYGAFADREEYIEATLEAQGVPTWLIPYVDADSLVQDWWQSGAIWVLEDPGEGEHPPALFIFRG